MEEIYKRIVLSSYYDENFGGNPKEIDSKMHGVCIDFSRNLIKQLRNNGYSAGLISTLNDDGYLHAAVIYRDKDTDEVFIADPVTDVRQLTGKTTEEIEHLINEVIKQKNYSRTLREYHEEMGAITDYDDSEYEKNGIGSPIALRQNMENQNEILSNPQIVKLEKKTEGIQRLTSLSSVIDVADTTTLLACQLLYEKGINTFCSNYSKDTGYSDIAIHYNSLSEENKKIFLQLMLEKPQNYKIKDMREVFGYPSLYGESSSIDENFPMAICLGYGEFELDDMSEEEQNLKLFELIKPFKKQTYMHGVYSREDVLSNKHHRMQCDLMNKEEKLCNSSDKNTNQEIAKNEGLIYSVKYDMFFEDSSSMSRYIESLYRKENDWRTDEEIAIDAGIEHKDGLFLDDYLVTTTDIVKTSQLQQTNISLINKFKNMITKVKSVFRGR